MWTLRNSLSPHRAGLSGAGPAADVVEFPSSLDRWLRSGSGGAPLSPVERAELNALRSEGDPRLFYEALLGFAARCEASDRVDLAAEIYSEVAAAAEPAPAARARLHLDAVTGRGAAGPRAEFLLRRLAREASDPAMLFAMGSAGAAYRMTRLAVLGRLAATPGAGLFTRGFGARAVASLAGFAIEAPVFTFTGKLAGEALGRRQDWSRAALGRELASSYLVLGGMKLAGWGSGAAYRGVAGSASARPLQAVFQQTGMLSGIMLGHRLEEGLGLRPRLDGATTLVDSLAMLLQFNVAGRLTRHAFGDRFAGWERSLDLQTEILASHSRPALLSEISTGLAIGPRPVLADTTMMSSLPAEDRLGDLSVENPTTVDSAIRPAPPRPRGERSSSEPLSERPSAEGSLRRLLNEARPLGEEEKRELIARVQSGDSRAAELLIRSDIRYVAKLARYYSRAFGLQSHDYLDLVQEGCRSLVKTAERFDLTRANKFLTYATWWIRADVTRYILDNLQDIRVPVGRSELLRNLRREVRELRHQGEEFGTRELAERMDLSERQILDLQAQENAGRTLRLETPVGTEGDLNLLDLIASPAPGPDHALLGTGLMNLVRRFIESRRLESDRVILEARLLDGDEPSHAEVSERLGLSVAELRGREKYLLSRLQLYLSASGLRPDGSGNSVDADGAPALMLEPLGNAGLAATAETIAVSENPRSAPIEALAPPLRPRIAVIGFGMAGIGATHALRNFRLFSDDARELRPEITVFEGMNRVGGKVAPGNLGAQFVDRRHFYPIDRLVSDLQLETGEPRGDYDLASFVTRSGTMISGAQFSRALRLLRQAAREALRTRSWEELDRESAADFIRRLGGSKGPLDDLEVEAMVARLGFEEGTLNVSMLSFAINLAKSETPMERYEIVGGLHRLAEAERAAVEAEGGRVLLGHTVHGIEVMREGLDIYFNREGSRVRESFDYGILALAPEHLRRIEVSGTAMPLGDLARLNPAHIVKTNLRSNLPPPEQERATARFAMWFSPDPTRSDRRPMVTFFHGWNGEPMMTIGEMVREAYGEKDPDAMVGFDSQIWDGRLQDGISHFYTTMPEPGRGMAALRFAMDQYFQGRYDAERLKTANHVLGLGCYIRDAALSGEWAAISLMRGMGMDVRRAYIRNPRPEREFIGAERIR